jgi:hypothetical protein
VEDMSTGKLPTLVRKRATVSFRFKHEAAQGEEVLLVLGTVEKKMTVGENNVWTLERSVKKEQLPLEYKFVIANTSKPKEEWVHTPLKTVSDNVSNHIIVDEKL